MTSEVAKLFHLFHNGEFSVRDRLSCIQLNSQLHWSLPTILNFQLRFLRIFKLKAQPSAAKQLFFSGLSWNFSLPCEGWARLPRPLVSSWALILEKPPIWVAFSATEAIPSGPNMVWLKHLRLGCLGCLRPRSTFGFLCFSILDWQQT